MTTIVLTMHELAMTPTKKKKKNGNEALFVRCIGNCGRMTGHKSDRCEECRTKFCKRCTAKFASQNGEVFCAECTRKRRKLEAYRFSNY